MNRIMNLRYVTDKILGIDQILFKTPNGTTQNRHGRNERERGICFLLPLAFVKKGYFQWVVIRVEKGSQIFVTLSIQAVDHDS